LLQSSKRVFVNCRLLQSSKRVLTCATEQCNERRDELKLTVNTCFPLKYDIVFTSLGFINLEEVTHVINSSCYKPIYQVPSTHHARYKPIHQVHSKFREGKRSMFVQASPTCFRQSTQHKHGKALRSRYLSFDNHGNRFVHM
jgi:hypothetical protein